MRTKPFVGIPLFSKGGDIVAWAKVDPGDAHLAAYSWWLSSGYAKRLDGRSATYLHRVIMDAEHGLEVDHINRDRLDNRRMNLRVVTPAQNRQNTSVRPHSSRFRGVSFDAIRGKWVARAKLGGKYRHVGRFDLEEQAARAISEWRRTHLPYSNEDAEAA